MKRIWHLPPLAALVILIVAPVLYYNGHLTVGENILALNLATILWFGTALLRPLFAGSRSARQ